MNTYLLNLPSEGFIKTLNNKFLFFLITFPQSWQTRSCISFRWAYWILCEQILFLFEEFISLYHYSNGSWGIFNITDLMKILEYGIIWDFVNRDFGNSRFHHVCFLVFGFYCTISSIVFTVHKLVFLLKHRLIHF